MVTLTSRCFIYEDAYLWEFKFNDEELICAMVEYAHEEDFKCVTPEGLIFSAQAGGTGDKEIYRIIMNHYTKLNKLPKITKYKQDFRGLEHNDKIESKISCLNKLRKCLD